MIKIGTGLKTRLAAAIHEDNTIAVSRDKLQDAPGITTSQMAYLGLTKSDLKKLERKGFAMRGYKPVRRPGRIFLKGSERHTVWILLADVIFGSGSI